MEDSGIDSGDAKPICDVPSPVIVNGNTPGTLSSRMLQRKLGAKNRNTEYKKPSGSLLPLQRLPIPGMREQQPLVAWDTDESEEELVNFFPTVNKQPSSNQELADFSVEELSTDDDEDGDDLELVIPSGPSASGGPMITCCGPKAVGCTIL